MLKPLVALTVIHLSLKAGVAADSVAKTPAIAPVSRVVNTFKKTGLAFLAKDEAQEAELFELGCVALAPKGTALDDESLALMGAYDGPVTTATAAPTAASMTKPASESKTPAKAPGKAKAKADAAPAAPAASEAPAADDTGADTGLV